MRAWGVARRCEVHTPVVPQSLTRRLEHFWLDAAKFALRRTFFAVNSGLVRKPLVLWARKAMFSVGRGACVVGFGGSKVVVSVGLLLFVVLCEVVSCDWLMRS